MIQTTSGGWGGKKPADSRSTLNVGLPGNVDGSHGRKKRGTKEDSQCLAKKWCLLRGGQKGEEQVSRDRVKAVPWTSQVAGGHSSGCLLRITWNCRTRKIKGK